MVAPLIMAPLIMAGREAMVFSSGMVDIQQKADLTNAEMVKMQGNILRVAQATHQLPEDMRAATGRRGETGSSSMPRA